MKVRAKYMGLDGSCGFNKGKVYDLNVINMHIETIDGKLRCPYQSLQAFFVNWEVVNDKLSSENKGK